MNRIIKAFKDLEILETELKQARKNFLEKKKELYGLLRAEARK